MTVKIADAHDRVHVLTANYEWTILRGFERGKGPCYISDVRSRHKPQLQPVADGGKGHTINDPRSGGLFGFGLVAYKPPQPITKDTIFDPAVFWDNGWEITMRLPAGPSRGFGVVDPHVTVTGADTVESVCQLYVAGAYVTHLQWWYVFGPDDQVTCELAVTPQPAPGLWIKEPKVVANGLYGHRKLTVSNAAGGKLGSTIDLTRFTDPRKNTKQIPYPTRCRYLFEADGAPQLLLACDNGLNAWTADADAADPMTTQGTPAYCLNKGKLWNRTEVYRYGDIDTLGLGWQGWQGGYGAPDCLACFRPWPTKPTVVRLGALIGPGVLKLPDPKPPKPPAKVRWPDALWNDGSILYVAWGVEKKQWGPTEAESARNIAAKAAATGFRAISFENVPENEPWQTAMKEACHANRIGYGIWGLSPYVTEGSEAALVRRFGPDFYEADWEVVTGQSAAEWAAAFDRDFPNLPRRLLATGGGIPEPVDALPWLANWDCALQDYYVHGVNFDPDHAENFAFWRGFPLNGIGKRHYTVVEIEAEGSDSVAATLPRVNGYRNAAGKLCVGFYLAEYLTDDDWAAIAAA